ncbi:hypothetical protein EN41_07150 [Agrobacterium tumefaciens]|jgi:hypothetical protein|uniref:Uncharacterized protein n=1 Tax=Agrobacterium fabrum (strain C58 / ATCC 33970) TaxID=176299 RepID=Q8UDZ8_AGRFC|nr:hypothetical protein Atu1968 [Agrobacterium fabrum str. C58]KEY50830.1 hypothetical protein EN41_07150 [Agrobacterium tumefaciens]NMV72210.1 hypothetical protein [Agrobacterium fabrum]NSZ12029.1 hypothetical protein [Agrobacterium fabrum]QRM58761.1 hypothetical protein F3P66_04420 [Agrobacterium fabrum]
MLPEKARKHQFPGLFHDARPSDQHLLPPHSQRAGINRSTCCNIMIKQGNRDFSPMDSAN